MVSMYRWSRFCTRLLYKIRHHKGHGIHSPFVFNLINNVIEEKLPYYCYQDLSKYISQFSGRYNDIKVTKDNLLAFRLVNYFGAKKILEIGSETGINTLYLTASSSKIECLAIEEDKEKFDLAIQLYESYKGKIILRSSIVGMPYTLYDCIYINIDAYDSLTFDELDGLVSMCHEKSFIMVKGIRTSKKQNVLWKRLTANEQRTAELDLFDIGLLFFDKQLYRWKYQISF